MNKYKSLPTKHRIKKKTINQGRSTQYLLCINLSGKRIRTSIHIYGNILQEMRIPDHLTCLLRNLDAGQEATVRSNNLEPMDWFQLGKGVCQGCILSPSLFNFYAEYIMQNARLDEAQAGIKTEEGNIKTSDMQMTPPLWQKAKGNERAF